MDPFEFIKQSNDIKEQKARSFAKSKEEAYELLLKAAMTQRDTLLNSSHPEYFDRDLSDAIKRCNILLSGEAK